MIGRRLLALGLLLAWGLAGCAQASLPGNATRSPAEPRGSVSVGVRVQCSAGQWCGLYSSPWSQTMTALIARARRGLETPDAFVELLDHGDAIQINLPGYHDQQVAVSALTTQGAVRFIEVGETPLAVGARVAANQYPVLFTTSQLDPGSVRVMQSESNLPIVTFEFQGNARAEFANYTRTHMGDYLTITRDNVVVESAMIQSEITGQVEITVFASISDARAMYAELRSPPLPYPVILVSAGTLGR